MVGLLEAFTGGRLVVN